MNMPKMIPIPIKTQGKSKLVKFWRWLTFIRKWELTEDWKYQLPSDKTEIIIPKGLVFDGASIPRPLWMLLSPTGLLFIPGLIHDFGYRYDYLWTTDSSGKLVKYKENSGRKFWDDLFWQVNLKVNDMVLIGSLACLALYLFGWWSWWSNRRKKETEIKPGNPTPLISGAPIL